MKKCMLGFLCCMIIFLITACDKRKEDTLVVSAAEDSQAYWNNQSHIIAKLADGYCYFEKLSGTKSDFNGYVIKYWDPVTKESAVLCPNAECKHKDELCYGVVKIDKNKGMDFSDDIWSYKDNIYYICYNSANAVLVQVAADGSGHRELFELGPRAIGGGLSYALVFYDDAVYYYDRSGNYDGAKGKESTETIKMRRLSGGNEETVFSYTGENIVIENAKSYGDKLFFVVNKSKFQDGFDIIGKGLYCYDYSTKKISTVEDKSVYDYYVDVENSQLYYFVSHDGLYRRAFNTDRAELIYKVDSSTEICNFNIIGDRIFMTNDRWWGLTAGMGQLIPMKLLIMDLSGNIQNTILDKDDICFGDNGVFYRDVVITQAGKSKRCFCLIPVGEADSITVDHVTVIE